MNLAEPFAEMNAAAEVFLEACTWIEFENVAATADNTNVGTRILPVKSEH